MKTINKKLKKIEFLSKDIKLAYIKAYHNSSQSVRFAIRSELLASLKLGYHVTSFIFVNDSKGMFIL